MTYAGTEVLNYRLIEKLGEGGFGVVYVAEHTELPRKVAVKILHPEFSRKKELVDRFFAEASAVCAIGHDNIIDIQNFGRLDSGEPFFLMEYFDGPTLAKLIEERGPLPAERIADVLDPVVDALEAAHAKHIIHRDLKPENIMVRERDGRFVKVKLLDFGIAKLTDQSVVTSRSNIAMGTPQYMAPEQARDAKSVDPRADVYSFGATAYAALSGRPPFLANNLVDLIMEITSRTPPPLDAVSSVPKPVAEAIGLCLAKEPDGRPPTIRAAWDNVASALAACELLPPPIKASRSWPIPEFTPRPTPPPRPPLPPQPQPDPPPDRRWVWALVALGVIGGGAAVAGVALSGDPDPAATPVIDAAPAPPVLDAAPPVIDATPVITLDATEIVDRADAAAPPPRVDAGATCDPRSCSLEPPPPCCARLPARYTGAEIAAALRPAQAVIKGCFALHDAAGDVIIRAQVLASGTIRRVRVARTPNRDLGRCIVTAIRDNAGRLPAKSRGGDFRHVVRDLE